jgi:hypothetical protein
MKHVDVIERLQRIRNFYRDTIEDYTAVEAVDMAISSLEFKERYDQFWEEVKTAGMNGKETEIRHSGRVFRIREVP